MDNKTYNKIRFSDDQFMRRYRLIEGFKKYGFTFSQNKKHILVTKEPTVHSLQNFQLGFPLLDNAIFFVEGYVFYLKEFAAQFQTGDADDGSGDAGPKPPTVH
jgi:hypothetical protein